MPDWPITEPPPHIAELFRRYRAGDPYARQPLTVALYRHRGTRFVLGDQVFWLYKRNDFDDDAIGVCPRSIPLTERRKHHGNPTRAAGIHAATDPSRLRGRPVPGDG